MEVFKKSDFVKNAVCIIFSLAIILVVISFGEKTVLAADSDIVNIPDANFKAYLNEKLGVEDKGANITKGLFRNDNGNAEGQSTRRYYDSYC